MLNANIVYYAIPLSINFQSKLYGGPWLLLLGWPRFFYQEEITIMVQL